jgi:hypothetical protein
VVARRAETVRPLHSSLILQEKLENTHDCVLKFDGREVVGGYHDQEALPKKTNIFKKPIIVCVEPGFQISCREPNKSEKKPMFKTDLLFPVCCENTNYEIHFSDHGRDILDEL